MRKRKADDGNGNNVPQSPPSKKSRSTSRPHPWQEERANEIIKKLDSKTITEISIKANLIETIENINTAAEGALGIDSGKNKKGTNKDDSSRAVYLVPCYNSKPRGSISNSVLSFHPMIK